MQVDRTYSNYNTPTFTSYKSALSRKLEDVVCRNATAEYDILDLTSRVENFIKTKAIPERMLGKGSLGKVFKIDSNYVLKLPVWDVGLGEFKAIPSRFSELKTYYGDEIASFGHIKILKSVSSTGKHTPIGIPYSFIKEHSSQECSMLYEREYFPRLTMLPQKAFDLIASDCAKLNQMQGYMFDFKNPNNFVIVGNEIRVVDSICPTLCYQNNSISNLMRIFLWAEGLGQEAVYNENLLAPRREILKKIVLAGMKYDLPIVSSDSGYVLDEVLELLCRANVKADKFEQALSSIKLNCSDPDKRFKLTQAYLDKIFDEV